MTNNEKAILKRDIHAIADHYGISSQLDKTLEECRELAAAIIGYMHKQNNREHIAEEMADVKIMLTQLEYLLHLEYEVKDTMRKKVDRQLKRIEEE